MITLLAVVTLLATGEQTTFKVLTPFPTEQLCIERSVNLRKFVRDELASRGLTETDVSIETKCVTVN